MVNVQYILGNRHDLCEMLDIFLAKSVQYKYTTMYSTDVITIYRSYIALLTYSDPMLLFPGTSFNMLNASLWIQFLSKSSSMIKLKFLSVTIAKVSAFTHYISPFWLSDAVIIYSIILQKKDWKTNKDHLLARVYILCIDCAEGLV